MSGNVSTTEASGNTDGLFTAFKEGGPVPRGRWAAALMAALVPVVLGVGFWALAKGEEHTYRLITPAGIKSVRGGMTTDQVVALLGRPIALEQDASGAECYRYGQPNFVNPQFLIYTVCYENGKLRDVKQQKFSAWKVDPDTGTFEAPGGDAPVGEGTAPAPAGTPG
ncbi:hypothetical protein HPC49_14100 [Pyxidicoccus fallax]|uniref:Lipoprotein SmpA/OmlA domain-containing protein n=1 Tax=Pyxidicoccus fallax TaxID=394095 RepID=A0A848LVF1_9BACT|nr:hypothetical protein [Pyxidicoccus fallax]NMO22058.1 hypothetical protein [Pyxidicoccus fallax]NPC79366.1 hypothetical protein [Pyxidicoccus fallax]